MPVPDSVRLAMPAEAVDVARIQRKSWASNPALRAAMAHLSADETVRAWHDAIVRPPLAHCRVLVALGRGQVVGFAVTGPSADSDAEPSDGLVAEFVVDPVADSDGSHSGRLVNAAVDTLRADGYETATIWIPTDADALRSLLVETGWGADGAHQELGSDDGGPTVKLVRMVTNIARD